MDAAKGNGSSKKELAAFVRQHQARKELHAFTKQCKTLALSKDNETGSVSSSGGELDLSLFDYNEMANLVIDSMDEAKQKAKDGSNVSV
jgi:hypothetical protein